MGENWETTCIRAKLKGNPGAIYLFEVNNRKNIMCETSSKFSVKNEDELLVSKATCTYKS